MCCCAFVSLVLTTCVSTHPLHPPRFGIAQKLSLHHQVLRRLLQKIEATYCFDPNKHNAYHNALHAAFVVQAVGHFMSA